MTDQIRDEALDILRRIEPIPLQLVKDVAELKGRVADMPTARDFGRLEGEVAQVGQRISDINMRPPIAIGYTPPNETGKRA